MAKENMALAESIQLKHELYKSYGINVHHGSLTLLLMSSRMEAYIS